MYRICLAHLFDESLLARNRATAFLRLANLNKELANAETTITLNSIWEKGYFRNGRVLEVMERYDDVGFWLLQLGSSFSQEYLTQGLRFRIPL
ncbi:hypothetical protein RHMOL_Rhmol04G0159000 [Rhododendron molle]|uniref:Uncharacterized protein n=1 Tax=Rhododendron molle TaxID=49168 RepID=A0ACC0P287_RHOML|nr:hypothetical protein RHMOL_Rhmol04G0159000 [Rhododendron molle]